MVVTFDPVSSSNCCINALTKYPLILDMVNDVFIVFDTELSLIFCNLISTSRFKSIQPLALICISQKSFSLKPRESANSLNDADEYFNPSSVHFLINSVFVN